MQDKRDGFLEQFVRLACVETNELDNVFQLDGDSTMKLACCGFHTNSIEGISLTSRHKTRQRYLRTLRIHYDASTLSRTNVFENNLPVLTKTS
jgi:hypothetical protein